MKKSEKKENKIIENIQKQYMILNVIALLMIIYIFLFPSISQIIQKVIPEFGTCAYLKMTGNPCPLCGGTRYFSNMTEVFHDIRYLWHPFGIMAIILFLEFIFRMKNIIDLKRKKNLQKRIKIDIMTTAVIVTAFFLYEILFFVC